MFVKWCTRGTTYRSPLGWLCYCPFQYKTARSGRVILESPRGGHTFNTMLHYGHAENSASSLKGWLIKMVSYSDIFIANFLKIFYRKGLFILYVSKSIIIFSTHPLIR